MSFGAALAGGAQGVMGAWDDNRELAKEEAARAFQVKLEDTRRQNAIADRNQQATDLMNPETPTGMLAERKSKAASASQSAEWEHDERMADIKAGGKSKDTGAVKTLTQELNDSIKIINSDSASEKDKEAAKTNYARAMGELRAQTGIETKDSPRPTPSPAALAKLRAGEGTEADFAGFEKAFGLAAGSAKGLYGGESTAADPDTKVAAPKKSLFEKRAAQEGRGEKKGWSLQGFLKERSGDPVQNAKDTIDIVAERMSNGKSIKEYLPYLQRYINDESLPQEVREAANQVFMQ